MTAAELKEIKEKIAKESSVKRRMRRENNACFIPMEYYEKGMTKKRLFLRQLRRTIAKINAQVSIKEESDKTCVL